MNHSNYIDTDYIPLPEEYSRRKLNAMYRDIPLKDTTFRLLRKYFNALANLYGIIPLQKAYEIISSQNPTLVSPEEFRAFAEIAKHEQGSYYIFGMDDLFTDEKPRSFMEQEIIDRAFLGDELDLYVNTKRHQQDLPYYIPAKKELLAYDDMLYCEPTPAAAAIRAFLSSRFSLREEDVTTVWNAFSCRERYMNTGLQQAFENLKHMGAVPNTEKDAQTFASLYQDFHNTMRMQCNRGHTPSEVASMQPLTNKTPETFLLGPNTRQRIANGTLDIQEARRHILSMEVPNEALRFKLLKELADMEKESQAPKKKVKIGRNAPCPCGSGKKYKRCCGR